MYLTYSGRQAGESFVFKNQRVTAGKTHLGRFSLFVHQAWAPYFRDGDIPRLDSQIPSVAENPVAAGHLL